ncbi:hypothetical protein, partial [Parabacteroides sp. AM08-6]|uniref:hypothetical protein n=1 Tax=Parabacteroides sp. AM08-6 TaxID=2292053 RepID=UPI000FF4AD1A
MNKKFSTLLAGILLVGSSFSAMATMDKTDTSVYYQLKVDESKVLVIGEGEGTAKDSLALIPAPAVTAGLVEYNKSLWRLEAKEATNETTGAKYVVLKFINKAGKTLSLSNASEAGKSFYYSKPAYVATGGTSSFAFNESSVKFDEDGDLTVETDGINLQTVSYSGGKSTGLYLAVSNGAIKIKKIEQETPTSELKFPDETNVTEVKIKLEAAADKLTLGIDDLNKAGDDVEAFQLKFTPDTLGSTIGNPFTDNKLVAVKLPHMYSAAVYDTETYDAALADAKKATGDANAAIKEAWGAFKAEAEAAIAWGKANKFVGTLVAKAGNKNDLDAVIAALGTTSGTDDKPLTKLTTEGAAGKAFDAAVTAFKAVEIKGEEAALLKDADVEAFNKALEAADKAWETLTKNLGKSYASIEKVVDAYLAKQYQGAAAVPAFEGEDDINLAMLAQTSGSVYVQYGTAIATALDGLAAEAKKTKLLEGGHSADVLAEEGGAANGYYALAIKDSLIGGKQAYLYVDTANYIAKNEKYYGFKVGTLDFVNPENKELGVVADFGQSINLYTFQLVANPQKVDADEILINTWVWGVKPADELDEAQVGAEEQTEGIVPASVVLRTLANNHREVSVAAESDALYAELLKNTVITFNQVVRETAQLEKGTAYYVKSMSKKDEAKPYKVMTSTSECSDIMSANVYANVPSTQWFVSAADDEKSEYTIANRDFGGAQEMKTLYKDTKFYVIDAEEGIYEAAGDTIQLVEVEGTPAGYKNLSEEAIAHQTYKLTATNFANPTTTFYLTMNKADSSVVMTDDAEKALVFKLKDMDVQPLADNRLAANAYNGEVYFDGDTLFFTSEDGLQILLTKDAEKAIPSEASEAGLAFRRTSDKAGQYELLLITEGTRCDALKVGVDQNGNAVVVGPTEITNWAFDLVEETVDTYHKFADAPKNVTISLMNDEASKVTAVKPFAAIKRTGLELKAAAT